MYGNYFVGLCAKTDDIHIFKILYPFQPPEPAGTFYDSKRGILRPFPGGGVPVLVDYVCIQH